MLETVNVFYDDYGCAGLVLRIRSKTLKIAIEEADIRFILSMSRGIKANHTIRRSGGLHLRLTFSDIF